MKIQYEECGNIISIDFCCNVMSLIFLDFREEHFVTFDADAITLPPIFTLTAIYEAEWYGGGFQFDYCPFCGEKITFEESKFRHDE